MGEDRSQVAGFEPDAIVVGAGLAGLVAAYELSRAGRRVLVLDQENRNNLGGQAFWSLGGLFLVDSPEQRRLGIKDSFELAWQDWQGSAQWHRFAGEADEDHWAKQWGRAYVEFAASIKARGVLEVITAHADEDGTLVVQRGQRRTIVAAEVGTPSGTVPVRVVERPEEADRIVDQLTENLHRARMRESEVRDGVVEAFGVTLRPEPVLVNCSL